MIETNFINVKRHNWIKTLFWVKLVKMLSKLKLIMHLNEASLSRFIKFEYSWISRGKSGWIRNTQFKDSISLISTIVSNVWTLTSVWLDTVKSITILYYLNSLVNYRNHKIKYNLSEWLLILDNCPSCQAKRVKNFLESWGLKTNIYLLMLLNFASTKLMFSV